jgi:hypothetical protein
MFCELILPELLLVELPEDKWTGVSHNSIIPDGFYLVGNSKNPQDEYSKAIIDSVRKVTHITKPDSQDKVIGIEIAQEGVVNIDTKALHICGGFTDAPYTSTTEVYPDSQ